VALPIWLLVVAAALVFYVSLSKRPYFLLLVGILSVMVPGGDWQLAGVRLDPRDLVIIGLLVAWSMGRVGSHTNFATVRPFVLVWVFLGIMLSLAYIYAPINQEHLTDPIRGSYQVYRYAWKQTLYFPLGLLLIGRVSNYRHMVLIAIIVAGDLCALQATFEGYFVHGGYATGPFRSKNALGGGLIMPMVVALAVFIFPQSRRERQFAGLSALVIARGLLFASSRGAFGAVAAAAAFSGLLLMRSGRGRQRLVRLVVSVSLCIVAAFVVQPDLLNRPMIRRLITTGEGTQASNFQWRLTQRWPHFWEIAKANPILGVGSAVDSSLGDEANTPHNGYLTLSVLYGMPATAMIVFFGIVGVFGGIKIYQRGREPTDRMFGLAAAASVAGILVHNIVESTLLTPFVINLYFLLAALVVARLYTRAPAEPGAAGAEDEPPPSTQRPLRTPLRPTRVRLPNQPFRPRSSG
jgi:hypothetical protein